MGDAIPQHAALRLQLAAIAGNEPLSSMLEIRPLGRDGRPAIRDRSFVPVRELDQAARRCVALAGTLNVFVGAAPRVREDGTAAAVERVWCLWVDLDGAAALAALSDFRPSPSIVIRSGSDDSAHAYWSLREQIPAKWAQRANRRLAFALGADRAATDPARILRAAGTLNHKHAPPRPVVCTRLELDAFRFEQVVTGLADTPHYTPRSAADYQPPTGDPVRLLAGLVRTVAEARQGNRNHALFWAACRAYDHVGVDADTARRALRDAALAAGLSELETAATIHSAFRARHSAFGETG